nr:hypothetical protein DA06_06115 [Georgenia sp. SUBG003]
MRPKKPSSTSRRSFTRPGRYSLSWTTPAVTPVSSPRSASATASSRVSAVGFSVKMCFPARIAAVSAATRREVTWASK